MAPPGGSVASLGPGKGRSSALPLSVEGRQVAAANSTLNAWSGRRQPSWLTNATPVQPSPRPPRPPPATGGGVPLVIPPAAEITSSQPQPQPQPQSPSRSQLQLHNHPPPQPPSQSHHPLQTRLGQQLPQSVDQPAPSPPTSIPTRPPPSHPSHLVTTAGPPHFPTPLADPALPSPAASDEPSPRPPSPTKNLNTESPCPVSSHDSSHDSPPTTTAHFVLESHANSRPLPSPQIRALPSPVPNGQSASLWGAAQPPPVVPSVGDMADRTSIPSVIGVENGTSLSEPTSLPSAPKRRRFENLPAAFLQSHDAKSKLNAYSQEIGGETALEETVERPRFLLLDKACREGDVFFVALHQLFCSWTLSQISVHRLCDEKIHDASLVDNAFGIMGTILKANSKLREPLLNFFANFPMPLSAAQQGLFYRQAINLVLDFLINVSRRWLLVNHENQLNGYPLLMSELINIFHLHSPTLQSIVFRASRRTLGVPDHPIGVRMDQLFKTDQDKHWNVEDGSYSLRLEGVAYEKYNNDLIKHYQSLVNRAKRTTVVRSSQSPSMPSATTAHSSTASSPSMAGEHFHFDGAQGARPLLPAVSTTRRVSTTGQNIHSPSPTYTPIPPQQPLVSSSPNIPTTFAPQIYTFPNHANSSYQPTSMSQQGQLGASDNNTQQNPQPNHADLLRQQQLQQYLRHQYLLQQQQQQQQLGWPAQRQQQQQQQQPLASLPLQYQHLQQQQQLHNVQRNRSQPGATPSPRPSPIQSTHILPSQAYPARHMPTQSQNAYNQPISPASLVNPPFTSSFPRIPQQQSYINPLPTPQGINGPQLNNDRTNSNIAPQEQPDQTIVRLMPPHPNHIINLNEFPHTPYDKRSIDMSLHQAHLRSPKRVLITPSAGPPERHYQAIKGFALEPTPILEWTNEMSFTITDEIYKKLVFNETVPGEWLLVNRFRSGSLRVRARCCKFPMSTGPVPDHTWVTSETAWPEHIWMDLDKKLLEVMRKQHHSKDLPTELTSFIHTGVNTLTVAVANSSKPRKQQTYYIAVEIVEVLSHSAILEMVHGSNTRPANQTWEVIQSRLAGSSCVPDADNNDLEMSNDGISIDLADPFTAKIFNIPVRGKACKHLECFDLENWLNTRLGKKLATCVCRGPSCTCLKEPSFVDKWKCPFCDGDARPYSLYIDEFLVEVRTSLEQAHQLRTKSITVYANRSWKANDPAGDNDSDTESDDNTTRSASRAASKPTMIDIIEIDDDDDDD